MPALKYSTISAERRVLITGRVKLKSRRDADHAVERQRQPGQPVLDQEQDQHAEDQQAAGDDADDELREEVRQLVDVAVDALDQLAGGVRLMEGHVEPQQ